jgi:hypothetical protein
VGAAGLSSTQQFWDATRESIAGYLRTANLADSAMLKAAFAPKVTQESCLC